MKAVATQPAVQAETARRRRSRSRVHWVPMVVVIVLAAVYLLPLVWMISTSFKTVQQSIAVPPVVIPWPPDLSAFPNAISRMNFVGALRNTLLYAVPSVIGTLISCSLVAYGFAIVKWPGRDIVFVIVLATMMLPTQVTLIPLYVIYAKLGWINTFLPLVIPSFLGAPFFIFLLRQFFRGIPVDLLDAARIDGASELRILTRIVVPLSKPALITVGLLTFIDKWNDFYGPLIYLQKPELRPLSLALQVFQTNHSTDWPRLMAASVIVALPLVVIYFVAQRWFIEGLTLTGSKG
jgi:ABC-type glycerol-3-phosphate transport system permease component